MTEQLVSTFNQPDLGNKDRPAPEPQFKTDMRPSVTVVRNLGTMTQAAKLPRETLPRDDMLDHFIANPHDTAELVAVPFDLSTEKDRKSLKALIAERINMAVQPLNVLKIENERLTKQHADDQAAIRDLAARITALEATQAVPAVDDLLARVKKLETKHK